MRISDWSSDVCSSDLFGNQSRSSKPIVHIERCRGLCTIERLDVMVEHIFEVERCEIGKHLLFGEVTPRFDADDGHETLLCTGIPGDETSFVVGKFNRVGADLIRNTGPLEIGRASCMKKCVRTCRYRGSPQHKKKKK